MRDNRFSKCLLIGVALLVSVAAASQDGKLRMKVEPKEAYTFVDGVPFGAGSHTFRVSAGDHKITVANYGFKNQVRDVSVQAGTVTELEVNLDPVPGEVKGPWGELQIEGASVFAVYLNGKTPDYFVGHGDEFNHGGLFLPCCTQQLVVPAGTHQVTLVYKDWTLWSGPVTVGANERVILNAHD